MTIEQAKNIEIEALEETIKALQSKVKTLKKDNSKDWGLVGTIQNINETIKAVL